MTILLYKGWSSLKYSISPYYINYSLIEKKDVLYRVGLVDCNKLIES